MQSDVLAMLCDPMNHAPLEIEIERGTSKPGECLVNRSTGTHFPIKDGIPFFIDPIKLSGANQKYRTLYDRLAPLYDLSTTLYAWFTGASVETRLREYLDELEIQDGNRVLEVSIGTGRNLQFLPRTAHYFGLDISLGMMNVCRKNVRKWGRATELFLGEAENLPFKDETFDAVLHSGGINFFNDKARAICEMIRVAKPGTKFVIVDETEEVAQKYASTPVAGRFYGGRQEPISPPEALVPAGMLDIRTKTIANGDLFCLTFRKPQ